jgi:hypothetical protein
MALEDAQTLARTVGDINYRQDPSKEAHQCLLRWELHRQDRIERRVLEITRMGSNIRKTTKDKADQNKKEEELQETKTEDDLGWLYGYDGNIFVLGD